MANTTFRIENFRAWDPFHDKQQHSRRNEDICRYPSPVSVAAVGPQVSRDQTPAMLPENPDHMQRHPLPARPPMEVCLNEKSSPNSQPSQGETQTSPVVSFGDDFNDTMQISSSKSPIWIQKDPVDLNIDPAITHGSLGSDYSEEMDEAAVFQDSSKATSPFSVGSQCLGVNMISQTSKNETELLATSHHEKRRSTKRPNPQKKKARNGYRQLPNEEAYRSSHQGCSFATVRSQFLCMPAGDRLQFLSWLFQGAVSHCVPSTDTGFPELSSVGFSLDTDVMQDDCQRVAGPESTGAEHLPFNHVGMGQAHEKPPSGSTECEFMGLDDKEYEIEKILRHRQNANGSTSYLVRWKGYEQVEATWVPYVSVRDTAALDDYEMHFAPTRSPNVPRNKNCISKPTTRSNVFGNNSSSSSRISKPHEKKASRRRLSWTTEEARLIAHLRVELGLPWSQVYNRFSNEFPGRSQGSIQVFWSTGARGKLLHV